MGKPGGGGGVISTDARGRGKRRKRADGWEGWVSPGGGGSSVQMPGVGVREGRGQMAGKDG